MRIAGLGEQEICASDANAQSRHGLRVVGDLKSHARRLQNRQRHRLQPTRFTDAVKRNAAAADPFALRAYGNNP